MRRAAKVDRNQAEIVTALRGIGQLDNFGVNMSNNSYKDAGRKVCENCGCEYHSYQKSRKFCSVHCNGKSKTIRVVISCKKCGGNFRQHVKTSKYCSRKCQLDDLSPKKRYTPRPRVRHVTKCVMCHIEFFSSPSQARKYCSYDCFKKDDGAKRAGEAAVIAMKKYGSKKDANHSLIFGIISALVPAKDLSSAGFGVPDGLAWVGGGWQLFDIKNPKTGYGRRGLNPRQKKWIDDWRGGPVFLIYTEDEARRFAAGNFDGIKRFGGKEAHDAALAVLGVLDVRGAIS